jgi:hypothetical protein
MEALYGSRIQLEFFIGELYCRLGLYRAAGVAFAVFDVGKYSQKKDPTVSELLDPFGTVGGHRAPDCGHYL